MSLERLPSATRDKLRSAQLLTSVPQAVSELLQNALDAGARHVEVGVDVGVEGGQGAEVVIEVIDAACVVGAEDGGGF